MIPEKQSPAVCLYVSKDIKQMGMIISKRLQGEVQLR